MPTFLTERMTFVHVPKTGGSWITQAVRAAGVPLWAPDPSGDQSYSAHGHADLRDMAPGDRLSVAFVRHPLDWWRSYWGHRMRAGWDPANALDAVAASEDFNDFILNVIDHGAGAFDQIVRRFVGLPSPSVDFVGRFEHLVEDACEALRLAGEPFSASAIRDHPRENANDYGRFPALYRPEVAARLAESERQTIERFYAEDPVPAGLILGGQEGGRSPAARSGLPREAAENLSLRREAQRARALERALELSRGAQTRLESELEQAQTERDQALHALSLLQHSHLVRYTRTLRLAYYRARRPPPRHGALATIRRRRLARSARSDGRHLAAGQ